MLRPAIPLASLLALGPLALAQTWTHSPLFKLTDGPGGNGIVGMGAAVMGLGDIDADGWEDYAVGHNGRGYVMAVSGRIGLPLWQTNDATLGGFGGTLVKVPDADNDGVPDLLTGAPHYASDTGRVTLLSARTGAVLARMSVGSLGDRFGASMSACGDVNGDGRTDYIVGAPGYPGGAAWGRAVAISGADYTTLIADHQGFTTGRQLGAAVMGAGDLDTDGRGDYLIGEPFGGIQGQVRCYSGRFRILLYTLAFGQPDDGFGYRLTRAGDLDGDGDEDLLASLQGVGNGGLNAYDLRTGALLYGIPGVGGHGMGSIVTPAGDLDGDGAADFVLGLPSRPWFPYSSAGTIEIRSGRTGQALYEFGPPELIQCCVGFGAAVAVADVDGDGRPDLVVGQTGRQVSGGGQSVITWSFALRHLPLTALSHTLSLATGGRVSLDLDAGAGNAGRFYWFLASTSGQRPGFTVDNRTIPLNPDPIMLLFLTTINSPFLPTQLGVLDGSGRGGTFFQLVPGLDPALVGVTFDFAAVVFCPQFPAALCLNLASNARPVTLLQ